MKLYIHNERQTIKSWRVRHVKTRHLVVTEEQYRARVSQKVYELYQKRQAATDLEDWLEPERLVRAELLAEGQWRGRSKRSLGCRSMLE